MRRRNPCAPCNVIEPASGTMAEALGVISSIIAVLQAASVVAQGLDKIYSARNATEEIERLRHEADRLQRVVVIVHVKLASGIALEAQPLHYLTEQLSDAKLTVLNFERAVQTYFTHAGGTRPNKIKFLWNDVKGDVRRLRTSLSEARKNVEGALILSIFTARTIDSCDVQMNVKTDVKTIAGTTGSLATATDWTDFDLSISMKTGCRATRTCMCRCHDTQVVKWPHQLHAFLGAFSFQYRSLPWLSPPCDDEMCARQAPDFTASHSFPRWLWHGVIMLKLQTYAHRGPELVFRAYCRVDHEDSLFFQAAYCGNLAVVKQHISQRRQCLSEINEYGTNALTYSLYHARRTDNWQTFKLLLQLGADPKHQDDFGRSAYGLYWDHVLTNNADCDIHVADRLLDYDEDEMGQTALHRVIRERRSKGFDEALQAMCRSEVDRRDASGTTALALASKSGNVEQVTRLLQKGADPCVGSDVHLPCLEAYRRGHMEVMEVLLNASIDRGHVATELLYGFCMSFKSPSDLWILDRLYTFGADLNRQDTDGDSLIKTCVFLMSECDREVDATPTTTVRWLVDHGADVDLPNKKGKTAVWQCIQFRLHDVLSLLLDRSVASAGTLTADGTSILHAVALWGDIAIMDVLRAHHLPAPLEAKDPQGRTALDYAQSRWTADTYYTKLDLVARPPDNATQAWYEAFCGLLDHARRCAPRRVVELSPSIVTSTSADTILEVDEKAVDVGIVEMLSAPIMPLVVDEKRAVPLLAVSMADESPGECWSVPGTFPA